MLTNILPRASAIADRGAVFCGPDAPVAPTTPKRDPGPSAPPAPQEPAPTPTFTPSEDPGTDPAPTCPEGSPDEGDGAFETCCFPSDLRVR